MEVTLSQLHISNTHLTHSYSLEDQASFTVKHILIESTHLALVRPKYYKENNIKLFENVKIDKPISYLKVVNIYK